MQRLHKPGLGLMNLAFVCTLSEDIPRLCKLAPGQPKGADFYHYFTGGYIHC